MKLEAEARQRLADVEKQLERYKSVYGDASSLPPDVKALSEQLQRKNEENDKLKLQEKQREQVGHGRCCHRCESSG